MEAWVGVVLVDGRTDPEKLKELLFVGAERSEVEFKERLDLGTQKGKLDFVKDAVSMFNRYPGGYIIVGATNEGFPSDLCEDADWRQFDGANLTNVIRGYVDAPITAVSAMLYRLMSNEALNSSRYAWGFDSVYPIGAFLEANPPTE